MRRAKTLQWKEIGPRRGYGGRDTRSEEIAKVRQEWEEKRDEEKEEEGNGKVLEETTQETRPATAAPTPTHEGDVLRRNISSLRVAEHWRRRQAAQAKTLAPRLPDTSTDTIR